jgi:hypothetical protein
MTRANDRCLALPSVLLLGVLAAAGAASAQAIGTAFTYQGQLLDSGSPANGSYDFQLVLYDVAIGGSQVGPIVTRDDVAVGGGLFTVALDFGTVFNGAKRFLEIGVRPGASGGGYTVVGPRQELTPAPNTLYSSTAPWSGLGGVPAGFADGIDNDSGGDVTGVAAGTGLTGGGTAGDLTLNVSFAGDGSAPTAARSDHDHFGQSWTGAGSYGLQVANSNADGVLGRSTATGGVHYGVDGQSDSTAGAGVRGVATSNTGSNIGVYGFTQSSAGRGVFGFALATTGTTSGVQGQNLSPYGYGVYGISSSTEGYGVKGLASGDEGIGVYGVATSTTQGFYSSYGVFAKVNAPGAVAVQALATAAVGSSWGLIAEVASMGSSAVYAVTPDPGSGHAGYFEGGVDVTGTLSKGAGSFKIDHPLDPESKYLYHSFVESPDMMNVYNGNVVLDGRGEAVIEMPEWFEALNRDFRYQLTAIGAPGPGLHVADKVSGNRFRIAGGTAGLEVSWQVTGIRKDAFAEAHRIPVEQDKTEEERGTYLHPTEHGMPREKGRDYKLGPAARERKREARQEAP